MTRRDYLWTLGGAALAATPERRPDFSGRWELRLDRSEAPAELPFLTQTVRQSEIGLRWTTLFKRPEEAPRQPAFLMGITDREGQVLFDGAEEVLRRGATERRARTVWDGPRLVTTWSVNTGHELFQGRWVRSLSADGRLQTINVEVRSARRGTAHVRLVFVKK